LGGLGGWPMFFLRKRTPVDTLISGYRRFRRTRYLAYRRLYQRLAEKGQHPNVLMIACSDSRVSPTTVFSADPGQIFVARNIASIVPPYDPDAKPRSVGAALEYAVKVLKVHDIVVLGHARCGGVQALLTNGKGLPPNDYLKPWVEIAAPARELCPTNMEHMGDQERGQCGERAVIQLSIKNMQGYPWIKDQLDKGTLRLHGFHFDFFDGRLSRLDAGEGRFDMVR
jgi:carbonic anhydrase